MMSTGDANLDVEPVHVVPRRLRHGLLDTVASARMSTRPRAKRKERDVLWSRALAVEHALHALSVPEDRLPAEAEHDLLKRAAAALLRRAQGRNINGAREQEAVVEEQRGREAVDMHAQLEARVLEECGEGTSAWRRRNGLLRLLALALLSDARKADDDDVARRRERDAHEPALVVRAREPERRVIAECGEKQGELRHRRGIRFQNGGNLDRRCSCLEDVLVQWERPIHRRCGARLEAETGEGGAAAAGIVFSMAHRPSSIYTQRPQRAQRASISICGRDLVRRPKGTSLCSWRRCTWASTIDVKATRIHCIH
jgi:hypothetical protein